MGRKPKPLELKQLEGDIHKARWNLNAPKPKKNRPPCPRIIKGHAKQEWNRIVPELEALGLLTNIDMAALVAYCKAWERAYIAELKIEELSNMSPSQIAYLHKTTNGNLIINPLLSVANKAYDQMKSFITEFGMTPASRTRINLGNKSADEGGLESFFNDCDKEYNGG